MSKGGKKRQGCKRVLSCLVDGTCLPPSVISKPFFAWGGPGRGIWFGGPSISNPICTWVFSSEPPATASHHALQAVLQYQVLLLTELLGSEGGPTTNICRYFMAPCRTYTKLCNQHGIRAPVSTTIFPWSKSKNIAAGWGTYVYTHTVFTLHNAFHKYICIYIYISIFIYLDPPLRLPNTWGVWRYAKPLRPATPTSPISMRTSRTRRHSRRHSLARKM